VPAQNYQRNWHVDAMARHLQECFTVEIKRLLTNYPAAASSEVHLGVGRL